MEFSLEKRISFDKYVQGNNIFITGPGTGNNLVVATLEGYILQLIQRCELDTKIL